MTSRLPAVTSKTIANNSGDASFQLAESWGFEPQHDKPSTCGYV
nr:MAG TPA: hypothetical protein [Caudoviricetes sp.]